MLSRSRNVASVVAILSFLAISAVHADQWEYWTLWDQSAKFDTEGEAAAYMRAGPDWRDQFLTERGEIDSVTMQWARRAWHEKPVDPDISSWDYTPVCGGSGTYSSEGEATNACIAEIQGGPGQCDSLATLVGQSSWNEDSWTFVGPTHKELALYVDLYVYNAGTEDCDYGTGNPSGFTIYADRTIQCPAGWTPDLPTGECVLNYTGWTFSKINMCVAEVGDPCEIGTGSEIIRETDYSQNGLTYRRALNSQFHNYWADNYFGGLVLSGSTALGYVTYDGYVEPLEYVASGKFVAYSGSGLEAWLEGGEWTVYRPSGDKEVFDTGGRLKRLENAAGQVTTVNWGAGSGDRIESIVGPFGHTLTLAYDSFNQLVSLTDPAGQEITYEYDGTGRLVTVTYQDSSQRNYHYEDNDFPLLVTGITDENGDRYATFTYDDIGRVITSEHANGYAGISLSYYADSTVVTDAELNQTTYNFVTNPTYLRKITSMSRAGTGVGYSYPAWSADHQQRPTQVTDENGIVTAYAYDTHHKTAETKAYGTSAARTTSYSYLDDATDRLTSVTSPSVYASGSRQVETTYDTNGLPMTIEISGYTPSGTVVSQTINLDHNSYGQVIGIDGPRTGVGDITTLTYYECTTGDECGRLESVTNALGHATTYDSYDAHGHLLQMTSPNDVVTTYSYDLRGHVLTMTETPPSGPARTTTYSYDYAGQLTTAEMPNGMELTYAYDEAHNLISITDNFGNKVEYSYDLNGNLTDEDVYDPYQTLTKTIDYDYDSRDRLNYINAGSSVTTRVLDALGNLTEETDPLLNDTEYDYDPLNRLIESVDALSGTTEYAYDINDYLTTVDAPNDATTYYVYDDLGNLLVTASPDTGNTSYTYDAAGNMLTRTDANGVTVQYTYDAINRLTAIDYPDSTLDVTLTYDAGANQKGRLTTMVDASGTTTFSYDVYGNLTQESKSIDGNTHVTAYTYDAANLIEQITYPSGRTVDYTRNALGQITEVETTYDTSTTTVADNVSYEPFGPLNGLTFGNGLAMTRAYDQQYRLTAQATGSIQNLAFTLDSAGNIDAIDDAVDTSLDQVFAQDALHRIDAESGAYGDKDYTYDAAGNRLTRVHDNGSIVTQTLTYTTGISAPDLSTYGVSSGGGGGGGPASSTNGTVVMGVDATIVEPGATVTLSLQNAPGGSTDWLGLAASGSPMTSYLQWTYVGYGVTDRSWVVTMPSTEGDYEFRFFLNNGYTLELASPTVTVASGGGASEGYLPWGGNSNRLSTHDGNTVTLDYAGNTTADPAESLALVYGDHNRMEEAYVGAVLQASYVYNGQGQRLKKVEATGDKRTFVFHYGLSGELIGETVYDEYGAKIAERDYVWLDTLPIAQSEREFSGSTITASSFVYIHADRLDTPRLATDSSQDVVWRWDSDAFGVGDADLDPDADTNEVNVRLRFPGQYLDEETGLDYNYFRDYDPVAGRYVESDPIGLEGGMNTYLYASGNPLRYFDPYGLWGVYAGGTADIAGVAGFSYSGGAYAGTGGKGTYSGATVIYGAELGVEAEFGFYTGCEPPQSRDSYWGFDIDLGLFGLQVNANSWRDFAIAFTVGPGSPGVTYAPRGSAVSF